MSEGVESLEASLGAAFGGEDLPKAPEPVAEAPDVEVPVEEPVDEGPEDELAPEAPEVVAAAEPEFEIEVDGTRETIRGADKVKELLQKGLHYSKNSETVAREREAITASAQRQQTINAIQQALAGDITELKSYDQALEQWAKVDWAAAFDADPFNAMKLREQRDQLREARTAKFNEFQQKTSQAEQALNQAQGQHLHAEEQALLAKLPEWRNSEKAQAEASKIKSWLSSQGYSKAEAEQIGDHRHMLVARKAFLYDQLMSNRDAKLKQVRTAPAVVKPGATPAQPNGRTEFGKAKAKLREFGTKGNHRAQENLASEMFERAFK
jgi:hypothetical protein